MNVRLDGKTAVVTGSIQGIGKAIAETLAECGASVIVNNHVDPNALEGVAEGIRKKGGKAKAVIADLTKRDGAMKLVSESLAFGGGRIDILVNNCGGLVKRVPIAEFDEAHFQAVVDVNLKSTFLMCHAVLPAMKVQKSGAIVNLSSQAAHDGGGPGSAAYSATKGGIWTMTKSLAKEVGSFGIRVNAVAPGFIANTVFHDTHTAKEVHDRIPTMVPLGRKGEPRDVANAVLFLASDLSGYMTGQMVEVNGGLYMY